VLAGAVIFYFIPDLKDYNSIGQARKGSARRKPQGEYVATAPQSGWRETAQAFANSASPLANSDQTGKKEQFGDISPGFLAAAYKGPAVNAPASLLGKDEPLRQHERLQRPDRKSFGKVV
jgi:hypothetical protein